MGTSGLRLTVLVVAAGASGYFWRAALNGVSGLPSTAPPVPRLAAPPAAHSSATTGAQILGRGTTAHRHSGRAAPSVVLSARQAGRPADDLAVVREAAPTVKPGGPHGRPGRDATRPRHEPKPHTPKHPTQTPPPPQQPPTPAPPQAVVSQQTTPVSSAPRVPTPQPQPKPEPQTSQPPQPSSQPHGHPQHPSHPAHPAHPQPSSTPPPPPQAPAQPSQPQPQTQPQGHGHHAAPPPPQPAQQQPPPPPSQPPSKPGWGNGDQNHDHSGPPGHGGHP